MADYPFDIYEPREKLNDPAAEYDPADPYIIFAEDVAFLDSEVVAIEEELGLEPKGSAASVRERLDNFDTEQDDQDTEIATKQNNLSGIYNLANYTLPASGVASAAVGGTIGVFVHGYVTYTPNTMTNQLETFAVETGIGTGIFTTVQVAGRNSNIANSGGAVLMPFNFFVPAGRKWMHTTTGTAVVTSLSAIAL